MRNTDWLYWSPRILGILYIGFLAVFALDVFIPGQTLMYYLQALLIHLLPNFILAVVLLISWKYQKLGSLLFGISFLLCMLFFGKNGFFISQLLIFSPLLLISFLFFIYQKKGALK